MIRTVNIDPRHTLETYERDVHLRQPVKAMKKAVSKHVEALQGQTVWMINSTDSGGGVAEMMPKLVALMNELGIDTRWLVIETNEPAFFALTKKIHNLIHGAGTPDLDADDRALYERVSTSLAEALADHVQPGDILAPHDPQPLAAAVMAAEKAGVPCIWRCHIGLEESSPETEAGWEFLRPWACRTDRTIFTLKEYVPDFLKEKASIIPPGLDPLSPKNCELTIQQLTGTLVNASLAATAHPTIMTPFEHPVRRLQPDGSLQIAVYPEELGLFFRPSILQVSRWDRLKGFAPLLKGFERLKKQALDTPETHNRQLEMARLVLAGPDPDSVKDDPEGLETFDELCETWCSLHPHIRRDTAVVVLPMYDRTVNAMIVNALQRCATIVVQNSLREGFGLTVTEAMWKRCAVVGTKATGIRAQLRDGVEGRLIPDAADPETIATTLRKVINEKEQWEAWSHNAHKRVMDHYLIFAQVQRWVKALRKLERDVEAVGPAAQATSSNDRP